MQRTSSDVGADLSGWAAEQELQEEDLYNPVAHAKQRIRQRRLELKVKLQEASEENERRRQEREEAHRDRLQRIEAERIRRKIHDDMVLAEADRREKNWLLRGQSPPRAATSMKRRRGKRSRRRGATSRQQDASAAVPLGGAASASTPLLPGMPGEDTATAPEAIASEDDEDSSDSPFANGRQRALERLRQRKQDLEAEEQQQVKQREEQRRQRAERKRSPHRTKARSPLPGGATYKVTRWANQSPVAARAQLDMVRSTSRLLGSA